jgi:hypothetical protein
MDIAFGVLDQLVANINVASGNVRSQINDMFSPFCEMKNKIEWGFIIVTGLVLLSCIMLVYTINTKKSCGKTSLVFPASFDMVKNKQFGFFSKAEAANVGGRHLQINSAVIALGVIAATIGSMAYAAYLMPLIVKPIAMCNGYRHISKEIDARTDKIPQYVNLLNAFAKTSTTGALNSAKSLI